MEPVLKTDDLIMKFGGLTAVNHFSIEINKNEIVGLIGPNGAGKTTSFNMITGVYRPSVGKVVFNGEDITGLRPDLIAIKGITRTFQNIRLLGSLPVRDNVMIGQHLRLKSSWVEAVIRTPRYVREEKKIRDKADDLLSQLGLIKHANEVAGSLPYGAQRRLEIARALATEPKFLLLDEPAAGMNPKEGQELMDFIKRVRTDFDLTILLIEHDMKVVMGTCERIYVLDYGLIIAQGTPKEIQSNERVIQAYLGVEE